MMYDDLVKNLRICSRCDFGQDCNGCTQDSNDQFCCDRLLHNAADAIEELTDMNVGKWMPVTERLPDMHVEVLVCTEGYGKTELGFLTDAVWDGTGWLETWDRKTYLTAVTHWMPLPSAPTEE